MKKWLDQINQCSNCDACLEVCPTYVATGDLLFSPKGRLETAQNVLGKDEITQKQSPALIVVQNVALAKQSARKRLRL